MANFKDWMETQTRMNQSGGVGKALTNLGDVLRQNASRGRVDKLVAAQDYEGLALEAFKAGDSGPLRQLLGAQVKGNKEKSLSPEELSQTYPDIDTNQFGAIAGLPVQQQLTAVTAMQRGISENRQAKETGRRERQESQMQRLNVQKTVDPLFKQRRDEMGEFDKAVIAMDSGSTIGDRVAKSIIAKSIGVDSGPLSNADITDLVNNTFEGDMQGFKNWAGGTSETKLTGKQKAQMRDIFDRAKKTRTAFYDEALAAGLSKAIADNPKLIGEDGKLDPSIQKRAQQAGFKYDANEGAFVKESAVTTVKVGEGDGQMPQWIIDIDDEEIKSAAIKRLKRSDGPPKDMKAFQAIVLEQLKQKKSK